MPRAIVRNGLIYPLDPLPPDWTNGKEVWVNDTEDKTFETEESPDAIDKWFQGLEESVAEIDPSDYEIVERALQEADQIEKARMRRETGL